MKTIAVPKFLRRREYIVLLTGLAILGGSFVVGKNLDTVSAAFPHVLPFSARLRSTSTETAVPDGNYQVSFKIYQTESGGSALWSETQTISVKNGSVAASLGEITPIPDSLTFNDGSYWLGITVGSDAEMVPRRKVSAVPLALNAASVDGLVPGTGADNILKLDGSGAINIAGPIITAGELQGSGATISGTLSAGELAVSGAASIGGNLSIAGNLIPVTGGSYDLGSASNPFNSAYINNLVVGTTSTSGTSSSSFTINQLAADDEDSALNFYRGGSLPSAQLLWNAANDRFEFNQNSYINGNLALSGNIGIGVANPAVKLTISDGTNGFGLRPGGGNVVQVRTPDDTSYSSLVGQNLQAIDFVSGARYLIDSGNVRLDTTANGVLQLTNSSNDDFSRLLFGGSTSAFPALKKSGTELQVRLADDSGYGNLSANTIYGIGALIAGASGSRDVIANINGLAQRAGITYGWSGNSGDAGGAKDTGLSRLSAGVIGIGNGSNGDVSGSLVASKYLGGTAADSILTLQGNSATSGNTAANAAIQLKVGNSGATTALTVLNSGNVGIGTTNPGYTLDVAGIIGASTGIVSQGYVGAGAVYLNYGGAGVKFADARQILWSSTASVDGTADLGLARSASGTLKVTDGSTGFGSLQAGGATLSSSVQVGTNPGSYSASELVNVFAPLNATAGLLLRTYGGSGAASLKFGNSTTASVWDLSVTGNSSTAPLTFNTDVLVLEKGGDIGVGVTDPQYKLDIAGDVNSSTGLRIGGTTICTSSGCTPATNSANYIQNGTSQQTGNFNISGNGIIGGVLGVATSTFGTNNKLLVNPYATVDNLATAQITTAAAANKGLVIQGTTSQSGSLMEFKNVGGTAIASIDSSGGAHFANFNTGTNLGVSIGPIGGAASSGSVAIGIGYFAAAGGSNAIAIGRQASAGFANSMAIGFQASTSAANQLVIGTSNSFSGGTINDVYIGNGVTSIAPSNLKINAGGASGADLQGASITIAGGRSTGSAAGGDILLQTSDVGTAGSTLNNLSTKVIVKGSGDVGIGTASPTGKLDIQGGDLYIRELGTSTSGTLAYDSSSLYLQGTAWNGTASTNQTGRIFLDASPSGAAMRFVVSGTTAMAMFNNEINITQPIKTTNSTITVKGRPADGASAIGVILGNDTNLTTAGAKLLSVQNQATEKMYVDKDGGIGAASIALSGNGTISGQLGVGRTVNAWPLSSSFALQVQGSAYAINDTLTGDASYTAGTQQSGNRISISSHAQQQTGTGLAGLNKAGTVQLTAVPVITGFLMGTTNNFPLIVATNNIERLRVAEGGNVGVGTTSPGTGTTGQGGANSFAAKVLEVSSTARTALTVRSDNTNSIATVVLSANNATARDLHINHDSSGNTDFYQYRNGSDASALYLQNNGNIGIGTTTSVDKKLTINGSIGTVSEGDIFSQYDGNSGVWYPVFARYWDGNPSFPDSTYIFGNGSNSRVGIEKPGSQQIAHLQVRAVKATFDGRLGIGTTGPTAKLEVVGSEDTQQLIVKANATQTGNIIEVQNANGDVLASISKDGELTATGVRTALSTKTAAYTLTSSDSIVTGDASGGAFSLTLPTAVGVSGRQYTLKKMDSSANAVTVETTSSQTIDGNATLVLAAQYDYVVVVSDGSNWIVVGGQ